MAASMAGSPSGVPGILINRLGRAARECRYATAAMVLRVSWTRSGDTSRDAHPSTPFVFCQMGLNKSAALVMSSRASSKKRSSLDFRAFSFERIASS
jgi:hypothetical protein